MRARDAFGSRQRRPRERVARRARARFRDGEPGSRPQPEVLFEEIVRYALRVAVARHHRFARMRKVPPPRLLGEPLAAYARRGVHGYHEMLDTIFRDSRWETEHCSGMRWRHVAACGSRIGAWCGHSARDLSQPGRLTCETAPDRTDTAPDDRGLCLVGYNNAYRCIPSIPATCTNGGKCFVLESRTIEVRGAKPKPVGGFPPSFEPW